MIGSQRSSVDASDILHRVSKKIEESESRGEETYMELRYARTILSLLYVQTPFLSRMRAVYNKFVYSYMGETLLKQLQLYYDVGR